MLAFVGSEIGRFWTIMSMLAPTSATTAKTRAATPGLFGHVGDGDLVLRAVVSDAGDDGLFHGVFLWGLQGGVGHEALEFGVCGGVGDPGAVLLGERGAHVQGHPVAAGEFDGAQVEDLGAVRGQFQGFFAG